MTQIEDWRKEKLASCRLLRIKAGLHVGTPDDIYCDECQLFMTRDCPDRMVYNEVD